MYLQRLAGLWKEQGCVGRIVSIGGVLLIALMALLLMGAIYEAVAGSAAAARHPAPGQLLTVNERTMHIYCVGEGSPAILLDAGQGGWSSDWAELMPQLSQENRVCAYDRAGYGWSEAAHDERSPMHAAADLEALLAAAEVEAPFVLVGFSHAGLAARIFANRHAEQMAGLVLIDPATEYDNEVMGEEMVQQQQSAVGLFQGFGLLARLGVLRLVGTENMAGSAPFISAEVAEPEIYYSFVADPQWWETSAQEFRSRLNEDHLAQVRTFGALPDIPVIVVASEHIEAPGGIDVSALQAARHERLRSLAMQSPQGEFTVAEGSSHNVLADRPDAVTEAVAGVMAAGD